MAGLTEPIRRVEDLTRIDDYLGRRCKRDQMLWRVGVNTGLRISDLRLLRKRDVAGRTHIVIRMTKVGRMVRVPVNPVLRRWLDAYCSRLEDNDYLFPSRQGWNKPITRSRAYQVLRQAAEACGLQRIGTHSLRKTFGWHLYQETGDIALCMELFGHENQAETLRYIGILGHDIDTAMRSFSVGGGSFRD
jgi:integrase